ncbi:MAG: bifunctional diaminohydroxyphosphoribosylaminopyrimidine deaminase/5-amino-6-(5-phosphoribosylamino)uracil reductase RibD, partial [Bacteroidia bacterium]
MRQCLLLAAKGLGNVAPNPMVGCVIVHEGNVIGEGYHMQYGGPHAEVNAINSVEDKSMLPESTVYVNLEPCSHYGKTPPCSDLLVKYKVKKVVIGSLDTNPFVAGKGIEKLKQNGIDVVTDVLKDECRELNKRFFTFQEKKRPYIILKWAETKDGFISKKQPVSKEENWITGEESKKLVHLWRTQEQAILIGTNTALYDNPLLTARLVNGKNPLRLVIDRYQRVVGDFHVFSPEATTIIFTEKGGVKHDKAEYVQLNFSQNVLTQILEVLYKKNISSVIVEGGAQLLQSFINEN